MSEYFNIFAFAERAIRMLHSPESDAEAPQRGSRMLPHQEIRTFIFEYNSRGCITNTQMRVSMLKYPQVSQSRYNYLRPAKVWLEYRGLDSNMVIDKPPDIKTYH